MKGIIILSKFKKGFQSEDYNLAYPKYDYALNVSMRENESVIDKFKHKEKCINALNKELDDLENEELEKAKNIINYIDNNFENLIEKTEFINIGIEGVDELEFIQDNPILKDKKIILNKYFDVTDKKSADEMCNKFKDMLDKIYVFFSGSNNYILLSDCKKTIDVLENKASEIRSYNLSPLEEVMYTYDFVRDRVYKLEDETESKETSRDLDQVVLGDKIVCAGYAKILQAILDNLGYRNKYNGLDGIKDGILTNYGHARNIVYIKDDKYDVDGVYYIDPTFDSKLEKDSNDHVHFYNHFGLCKKQVDKINKDDNLYDKNLPSLDEDVKESINRIVESNNLREKNELGKKVNYMSYMATGKMLLEINEILNPNFSKEKLDEKNSQLEDIYDIFNQKLTADKLVLALNNVRKLEHSQNPDYYPYSLQELYEILKNSDWDIKELDLKINQLAFKIFGLDEMSEEEECKLALEFFEDNNIVEDVRNAKLANEKNEQLIKRKSLSKR